MEDSAGMASICSAFALSTVPRPLEHEKAAETRPNKTRGHANAEQPAYCRHWSSHFHFGSNPFFSKSSSALQTDPVATV